MNNLDFAIKMEMEGKKYYLEQAELNKDNELYKVFLILAAAEQEHIDVLKKSKKRESFHLIEEKERADMKSIFRGLRKYKKERSQKQLDAYRLALAQEEKSIELYQEMLQKSVEPMDKELFEFLISQEKEHLELFEQLVMMLTRPVEWIESAEFGLRDEY